MPRPLNSEITRFILANVEDHGPGIASFIAVRFGVSRTTAGKYLKRLVDDDILVTSGQTRAKTYELQTLVQRDGVVQISAEVEDDLVWRRDIRPFMMSVSDNIISICAYGFTEMMNNVIDHSGSLFCYWHFEFSKTLIRLTIRDEGVGIFEKIQADFALTDQSQALLELSKGKLTSDPSRHSGEGIFFTSRMFENFKLISGHLIYARELDDDNQWLVDVSRASEPTFGTIVIMEIPLSATWTHQEVFRRYEDSNQGFSKTHVSIVLAKFGEDQLISRSQAKRVMARLEGFSEVVLDFQGVAMIGQGFADEIFRVFRASHPEIRVVSVRATPGVSAMISHVLAERLESAQLALL